MEKVDVRFSSESLISMFLHKIPSQDVIDEIERVLNGYEYKDEDSEWSSKWFNEIEDKEILFFVLNGEKSGIVTLAFIPEKEDRESVMFKVDFAN